MNDYWEPILVTVSLFEGITLNCHATLFFALLQLKEMVDPDLILYLFVLGKTVTLSKYSEKKKEIEIVDKYLRKFA